MSTTISSRGCPHRNIVIETQGTRRFVSGEVEDDLQEICICLDCLQTFSEAEAYALLREIPITPKN